MAAIAKTRSTGSEVILLPSFVSAPNTATGIWETNRAFAGRMLQYWEPKDQGVRPHTGLIVLEPSAASGPDVVELTNVFGRLIGSWDLLADPYDLFSSVDHLAYQSAPLKVIATVMVQPNWIGRLQPTPLADDE